MTKNYNDPFHHVNYNAIADGGTKGWGVKSGLEVSEDSPQGMDVNVAVGTAWINEIEYIESGITNLVISAAHATLPRRDIIIYDASTSNPDIITGIPATEPIPPDITSGDILLAVVNVAALSSVIINNDIEDGRVMIREHGLTHQFDGCDPIDLGVYTVTASDTVLHTNAPERIRTSTANALMKETILTCLNGTIKVTFDYASNNGLWSENRIYINNSPRGTIRLRNNTNYVTVSQDFAVSAGDRIQIYGKEQSGAGGIAKCRNLIIKATKSKVAFVDNDA